MSLNDYVWELVSNAGWWWWTPVVILCAVNLILIYFGPAPENRFERIARTLALWGLLCGLFAPLFNGMGAIAYPLLLLALLSFNIGRARLPRKNLAQPATSSRVHRVVKTLVGHGH